MSELIQWPKAKYWTAQWNPIIGCKPCSPACENCYAASWAKRFGQSFEPHKSSRWRSPRKGVVFCGNMTDLFGEWIHYLNNFIGDTAEDTCKGTYLFLTKRVERMRQALTGDNGITQYDPKRGYEVFKLYDSGEVDMSNHYFGFTAENQEWFEKRIEECIDIPDWVNLWLSLEPLLGAIDLYPIIRKDTQWSFKWVVVGCESGPNRRPCKIEWVESIVEQCQRADVPVFVKQICLPNGKFTNKIEEFPEHLRIRQVPWATKGETK